jgi:hypothetical protein
MNSSREYLSPQGQNAKQPFLALLQEISFRCALRSENVMGPAMKGYVT